METIILIVVICLVVLNVITLILLLSKKQGNSALGEQDKRYIKDAFSDNIGVISDALDRSNKASNQLIGLRLMNMDEKIKDNNKAINEQLENIRLTIERNVKAMQESNEKRLYEIQQTVDKKLSESLDANFKKSFELLTAELEKVSRTIGEMQKISSEVGSLSKMLSNVKTTGIFGEIQLGAIIDQMLSPEQYLKNVVTNKASRDPVEFAVKLPGGADGEVLLPIDSKFPFVVYSDMQSAYENNDFVEFESKKKLLYQTIKGMAKDIKEKYICPPDTTNFAIMFLPVEGLYSEVVKSGLVEELQQKYSVTVAGPTTMSALLNSLQMGFQTLAIQKKTGEVWKILGAVKTEFSKFGDIVEGVQKKLTQVNNDLDTLVGVRTRAINRTLRSITDGANDEINFLEE
ncbi:MAG: DNA recombination protein RmuC [Clostridia bacterium]|nr:DNA recombination protein RmuC [Clostridia bacterium]